MTTAERKKGWADISTADCSRVILPSAALNKKLRTTAEKKKTEFCGQLNFQLPKKKKNGGQLKFQQMPTNGVKQKT